MEVIKEFIIKSYIDASFYTNPDDSMSQFGYTLKVGAQKQHLQYDLEICEVHTDLNVADPLTKTSLTSKT